MDIIAQLKAERDKAAQQVNALHTAIKALGGFNSTGNEDAGRVPLHGQEFRHLKKHVGHAHGARRLSPSLPSVTSQQQV